MIKLREKVHHKLGIYGRFLFLGSGRHYCKKICGRATTYDVIYRPKDRGPSYETGLPCLSDNQIITIMNCFYCYDYRNYRLL